MANRGSGDFRRGRNREEEESRRGSGREGGDFGSQDYSGGREGYSEPGRGEYGRSDEEGGPQSLYGQGRRPEEPWRPGQAGYSEGAQYGGGYQERQPGPTNYRRSTGYRGYGSPDWSGQGLGYSGSRPGGLQSSNFDRGSEEFGGGRQGYAGTFGFGYGSGWTGSARYGGGGMTPRGRFSGKGPKGYSRSDDRITEDVCDRLEQHGEIDASNIEVRVESGEVTLEGTVDDRWTKRLAEDTVEDCPGVKEVHNRLRVQSPGEAGRSQSQSGRSDFGGSKAGAQGTKGSEQGSMRGTERSRGSSTTKSSTRT